MAEVGIGVVGTHVVTYLVAEVVTRIAAVAVENEALFIECIAVTTVAGSPYRGLLLKSEPVKPSLHRLIPKLSHHQVQ